MLREMAEKESDDARRAKLLDAARHCERLAAEFDRQG
jgi:hypothetical protein